jgi:demethylmenaquinone methyltransferase/2-methoxy-6-polyprenyl-1,4-benzoquinol methylase
MATFLRPLSYKYQWLYDTFSRLAALPLGGEEKFRRLPLQGLVISQESKILDLCCGSGQSTRFLVEYSQYVTGLDISPVSLARAKQNVPQAHYVEGLAEQMPLADQQFDLVHTSAALHEMSLGQLQAIFREVDRVLKPGGKFILADFHQATNLLFLPGLWLFLWLFETETAWQLLNTNLVELLEETGFTITASKLYAGGSLQVIQAQKP